MRHRWARHSGEHDAAQARLEALHLGLEEAYARWQYLEDIGL